MEKIKQKAEQPRRFTIMSSQDGSDQREVYAPPFERSEDVFTNTIERLKTSANAD